MDTNKRIERRTKNMKEYKGFNYVKEENNTYTIFSKDGKPWIVEFKTEEKVKQQIDDIISSEENSEKEQTTLESLQEQITNLELAMVELYEGGTK